MERGPWRRAVTSRIEPAHRSNYKLGSRVPTPPRFVRWRTMQRNAAQVPAKGAPGCPSRREDRDARASGHEQGRRAMRSGSNRRIDQQGTRYAVPAPRGRRTMISHVRIGARARGRPPGAAPGCRGSKRRTDQQTNAYADFLASLIETYGRLRSAPRSLDVRRSIPSEALAGALKYFLEVGGENQNT